MIRLFYTLYVALLLVSAGLAVFMIVRPNPQPGVPLNDGVWLLAVIIAGTSLLTTLFLITRLTQPPTPQYERK